jgi:hypothetical protein
MIAMYLLSGLGNMMFQIAFIESLAKRSGFHVGYANVSNNLKELHRMNRMKGVDINGIWKNVNLQNIGAYRKKVLISDTFAQVEPEDFTLYMGYAVSEKNFYSKEFIWKLFEPTKELEKRLWICHQNMPLNSCSIHVRRTDYVNNPGFAQIGMDYYLRAMQEVKADKYIIFSDDLNWCKENFKGSQFIFFKDRDDVELYYMSLCNHNIIANSTFSWWGAYLNQNPEKKVIAPLQWVADNRCTTDDIVPKEWIKI